MNTKKLTLSIVCSIVMVFGTMNYSLAAGWCGFQHNGKFDCGGWVVQMNLFNGGSLGNNDCVSYNGCVSNIQWDWSNPGAWTQLLVEKEGFCGKNYRVGNTADFNVTYNGTFSGAYDNHRLAIVSWGKTADNCNWTTNNLYELYIHEKSFNEGNHVQAYDSWCDYKGLSATSCSGSKYHLYDCGTQIIGRSIRCWRVNARTSGTTDVDCLWELWRTQGTAPNVYYYFTEVGAEVGPNSGGRFKLNGNPNMVRVANSSGGGGGGGSLVNNGIYRLKCNWGNKMLHNTNSTNNANVTVKNRDNSQWSMQWILRNISGNNYRIQARWGNRYLHSNGNYNNANVKIANLNTGANAQKWELKNVNNNVYRLRSHRGSKYLTGKNTNGGNVTVHTVNNGWSSQKWTLEYTGNKARIGNDGEEIIEARADKLQVYSAPESDFMNVKGLNLQSAALYNLNGQIKWQENSAKDLYNINVSDLKAGIYVIKAIDINGISKTHKLILR